MDKKIILIAGSASHGHGAHEHLPGCELFTDLLNEHVAGVTAVAHLGWPEDTAMLEGSDAIVVYSDGGPHHFLIPHLAEIDALVSKGIGLMLIHFAVEIPAGEPGEYFKKWLGGHYETHWSVNPHWVAEFGSLPAHPVTWGVKPFSMEDEWYYHMRFRDGMTGVTPLLSTVPPESSLSRPDGPHSGNPAVRQAVANKEPQHLSWCVEREDGGRGLGFTGGHYHKGWGHDGMRKFILNAIVWTAGMEVPADGIATPTPAEEQLNAYLG